MRKAEEPRPLQQSTGCQKHQSVAHCEQTGAHDQHDGAGSNDGHGPAAECAFSTTPAPSKAKPKADPSHDNW